MTSGVHDMCGVASVVPQTVPNQIYCFFFLSFFTAKENCVEKMSHSVLNCILFECLQTSYYQTSL